MWNYYTYLGHPNICPKNALFRLLHMVYFLHYWDVPTFAWKMHSSGVRTSWIFFIVGTSQHLLENALFRHAHMLYCLHYWDIPSFAWIMHSSGMHTWCIFYIVGMSQQFHEKMHSSGVHTSCIFYVVGTSQYLLKKCTLQACTQVVFFTLLGRPNICLENALFLVLHT